MPAVLNRKNVKTPLRIGIAAGFCVVIRRPHLVEEGARHRVVNGAGRIRAANSGSRRRGAIVLSEANDHPLRWHNEAASGR